MKNLQTAAAVAGQTVAEFCADVPTTAATPPTTAVEGEGTKKKDHEDPDESNPGPPNEDKEEKKPKGDD